MMKQQMRTKLLVVALSGALSACGTVNTQVREEIDQTQQTQRKQSAQEPFQIASPSRVVEVRGAYIPVSAVTVQKGAWLKEHSIQLEIRNPVPMTAVVSKLAEQGINIVSDLPLDSYTYVGKINRTDAEAALRAVLGAVGLDYEVDDVRKLVVVRPMASRSWFLNIGNRKSAFSSDASAQNSGSGSASATPSSSSTAQTVGATGAGDSALGTAGAAQSSSSTSAAQSSSGSTINGTGVTAADDFWTSLSAELANRLSIMVPRAMAGYSSGALSVAMPPLDGVPPMPYLQPAAAPSMGGMGGMGSSQESDIYVKHKIGSFSLNPETGAITVQAPHWMLNDLDTYLRGVQEMYNTDISFSGELVLVTSNRTDSEGLDISAFARWASGKYGAVIANNALGGVTVSLPNGGGAPLVQAGAQAVGGPLVGLTYAGANNALDIFNAYLSEIGKISVIQRPLITTTSGVPGIFSKKTTDYYNTVSQQAAAGGTGSAAVGTQNVIVPIELGTDLRINPRIDISNGLIRAQLALNQVIQSGTKVIPQVITFGNTSSTVNTSIPLLTKHNISGEILLRDGDLIVVGGQTEDNRQVDENGLPGADSPVGGVFGTKKASKGAQTYYFALRVSVSKRQ